MPFNFICVNVYSGNVLTSQRVTDVILKAFEACAASCGCMNNFTCGNSTFGYCMIVKRVYGTLESMVWYLKRVVWYFEEGCVVL